MLVGIDDIGLCVGRFDFRVSTEGGVGGDEVRIALQLEAGSGSWNGRAFDLDHLWVYGPGAEHAGAAAPHRAGRGATWATFSLPVEAVVRAEGWDHIVRTGGVAVPHADAGRLQRTIRDVVTEVRGHSLTVEQARRAGRELRETAASMLPDAENAALKVPSAYRITQRCLDAADDLDPMPTTAELAVASGVSDRWVRSAFDRVYGVSVSAFFRARSLHRARRALMEADPLSTSVAEVSMACGFWHLGRFAGYYHAHFGEYPRTTLRRAP
jgi:AraC-like DNA-binding protein